MPARHPELRAREENDAGRARVDPEGCGGLARGMRSAEESGRGTCPSEINIETNKHKNYVVAF